MWSNLDNLRSSGGHERFATQALPAESGIVGLIGKSGVKRGPILVLRCRERQAQIFVSFDLAVTGSEDAVPVQDWQQCSDQRRVVAL